MSRVPVPCFTAICDGGCGAKVTDDTEWAGWDEYGLEVQLEESNWVTSDDGRHLCDDCKWKLIVACEFLTGIEL